MSTGHEAAGPAASSERLALDRCVAELSAGEQPVDVAALAGEPPDPGRAIEALRERVSEGSVVACLAVLERLEHFVELVETLVQLSRERGATVVMAVPNHAPGAADDPVGVTSWGDGAVAELRGLLPADHVVFHEVALRGAAFVPAGDGELHLSATVAIEPRDAVPVAFVLAFGPRAPELTAYAVASAADMRAERAFERARTAELEVLRAGGRSLHASGGRSANGAPHGEQSR